MTARPLTPGLPPLTLGGLRDLLYSAPRACGEQPELFFGPDCDDETEAETEAGHAGRVAAARELCAGCPVRLACLAYALRTRPQSGVWAGLDADAGELGYLARAIARQARRVLNCARWRDDHPPDLPTARAAHRRQAIRRPAAPARTKDPQEGAPPMMSPQRLAVELGRRLDGPHDDEHTAAAAELCAEAVRFLNYATGPHSAEGLVHPATVYTVAADLSSAAWRMQQLFTQLTSWLAAGHAAGRLGTDDGSPVAHVVTTASVNLEGARAAAGRLSAGLAAFQNSISGLNGRGPDRAGGAL